MDLTLMRNPFDPDGNLIHWNPASFPLRSRMGCMAAGPRQRTGAQHALLPSGKVEQVRPVIGLYFTSQPPTRFPVVIELENDGALRIPPGNTDFVVSDDFRIPWMPTFSRSIPHSLPG